jgi:hypothetical protein
VTSWREFSVKEPEMAARVQRLFSAGRHKTMATVRADGSPRISGIECEFTDEHLTFGSMPAARKLADLRRDPRVALHSPPVDPVEGNEAAWPGEAKIAGRAVPMGAIDEDGQPQGESFAVDIDNVVVTCLNAEGTKLVVEWWTPATGHHRMERD